MFRVGQKVVCVDASDVNDSPWHLPLTEGEIYTIRALGAWPSFATGEIMEAVLLMEIKNGFRKSCGNEYCYGAYRFRPLIDTKTDISIFRKIDADVFSKVSA